MITRVLSGITFGLLIALGSTCTQAQSAEQSITHNQYAASLWKYLDHSNYQDWAAYIPVEDFPSGPPSSEKSKHFRFGSNDSGDTIVDGTFIVTEHYDAESKTPTGITARRKMAAGFDKRNADWYWVHFLTSGKPVATSADRSPWSKRGFAVFEEDGRLWVFEISSVELTEYVTKGELAKHVIRPGVGPAGMTIKSPNADTISRYLATKPGFQLRMDDGRLWVFAEGSEDLRDYDQQGELAKHVIRPGTGPMGITLKSPDAETLDAYLASKPGFEVKFDDGRLWVFRSWSDEWSEFQDKGELAKHVIRPGAGPNGLTLKSPDAETMDAYIVAQPGFVTKFEDGRVWVFRIGSPELASFEKDGELAKHVIRPGAGPAGLTLKGPDSATIEAYLRACEKY